MAVFLRTGGYVARLFYNATEVFSALSISDNRRMAMYLIRHAQSVNNSLPEEQRVEDPHLTDLGRRQSEHLAEWITSVDLTRLISSPFRRTLETAEHIRQSTGLRPDIWVDLHEQGGCVSGTTPEVLTGEPGMTVREIRAEFPHFEVPGDIDGDGWWESKPYETVDQARVRMVKLAGHIHRLFGGTDERVALVMHNMSKLLLLQSILSDAGWQSELIGETYNTSVTKISINGETCQLEYFNRATHLPDCLIT
jgi:broad specificity phosphatase PhoE